MTNRSGLVFRVLADLLVGVSAALAFIVVSHHADTAWPIAIFGALLIAAGVAGYMEPSARRVWIHALMIMSPELVALPCAVLTCHGFECGGIIAFLVLASLFTLALVGLSFTAFYVRRRITRPGGG